MDLPNGVFIDETNEILQQLEQDVVTLEKEPDNRELLNRMFRGIHTLKGAGGMFGYDNLSAQAHIMETVFDRLRNGSLAADKTLIDLTLQAIDRLSHMLTDQNVVPDASGWAQFSDALAPDHPPQPESVPNEVNTAGQLCYHIVFTPNAAAMQHGTRLLPLFAELRELGILQITADPAELPEPHSMDPTLCYTSFDILLLSSAAPSEVRDVFLFVEYESDLHIHAVPVQNGDDVDLPRIGEILKHHQYVSEEQLQQILAERSSLPKIGELAVQKGYVKQEDVETALHAQQFIRDNARSRGDESIKIASRKVDTSVNIVGEMITLQARLQRRSKELADPQLSSFMEAMELLVSDLRESVMSMRLVPLNDTFVGFRRLIRDLSHETGKQLELQIEGGETELDKNVIDRLKGALIHLLRNSADHGIETPAKRAAAGKNPQGVIKLTARYIGSQVEIELADDGGGVDVEKVRAKAVERGVLRSDEELQPDDVLPVLTAPGFSTADEVTSVSGRGVGMDVVKMEVESLSGQLYMRSTPGQGSSFRIRLPLTLAIIDSLLVRVEDDYFTIHLSDVDECFILRDAPEVLSRGKQTITYNQAMLPLVDLRRLMAIGGQTPGIANTVVTRAGEQKAGIVVDEIVGQYQAVIKPLSAAMRAIPSISGSTILGDGSISFILDVVKLVASVVEQ